ncbi:MAG TPA: alpha/beta hydrolase [Stellaceae bacterium]|nr:alpha/beta hydrolase [Stellaceae bacterium]
MPPASIKVISVDYRMPPDFPYPPTILTSGTRDLFLSNTVRVHRKLRAAGVEAELIVFEGQSHAQHYADPFGPETKEHFAELAQFLDRHLAK